MKAVLSAVEAARRRSAAPAMEALARLTPWVRVAREERRPPWRIPDRKLFDFLAVYIVSGVGRFTVGAETFPVDAGDFIWIPPDALHAMESRADPQHLLYAHFDLIYAPERSHRVSPPPPHVQNPASQPESLHPPVRVLGIDRWQGKLPLMNAAAVHQTLQRMAHEDLTARNPLVQAGLVLELLGAILTGLQPGPAPNASHQQALQRAADRILAAADAPGPLDLHALAREARLSLPHFRRLFRAVHGVSPRRMHQFARMQKACEWIDFSTWNLSEIALRLGFSNVHNFSRAFKQEIGRSPRAYRRRQN
ncbi:MAG: helix-turn-helix domain-containing protein [Planctomycetota bacterium]